MKIRTVLVLAALFATCVAKACPVCERNQPELFKGIAHGVGPENKWDYVVIAVVTVVVAITLFYSVKWLMQPGEKESSHIKRTILNND
ncbi:hypothetical protein [Sphingobacterium zeae]|uniref:Phage shock protein PspC (Stress-responsive transcriptional regulator) n=1 Tax=Sphingobacterium zeae TaxID=1776859 RepID=A0ABU0U4K6_9SPHI|nr:hypothetical protein [Sphingobacterium zeae]MDQ1149143.1 phage shock protein PspC (stress-responsive transcriptional regulator) [Sphingobacterium zeae]